MSNTSRTVVAQPHQKAFTELADLLSRAKKQIGLAVPKHLTPDRLIRVALTAWQRTPALQQCSPISILGALMQAAQLGLEPDGVLGHAYLVPFRNKNTKGMEAQFMIGYRGLLALTDRSDRLSGMPEAQCVFDGDVFDFEYGLNARLLHKPCGEDDPNKITHAWALARYKDGTPTFTVMPRAKIDRIRAQSRASDSGPWVTHYEEMARKTVLRRLCKTLPLQVDLQRHLNAEEMVEAGVLDPTEISLPVALPGEVAGDIAQEQPQQPAGKADRVADRIAGKSPSRGSVPVPHTRGGEPQPDADQIRAEIGELIRAKGITSDEISVTLEKVGAETLDAMNTEQASKALEILKANGN